MVRLKRTEQPKVAPGLTRSQFHYGSIKTHPGNKTDNIWAGLNSTMVRLKPGQVIKPSHASMGLNSTMVRLKLKSKDNIRIGVKSQFHYGSIKTNNNEWVEITQSRSQFHYGSIKTEKLENEKKWLEKSQFHYGSIKTKSLEQLQAKYPVSIPLWFD